MVEDKLDHRPKGFGYVEFGTVDGLKKALTLSETQFQGRNIRISIAEPRESNSIYTNKASSDILHSKGEIRSTRDQRLEP